MMKFVRATTRIALVVLVAALNSSCAPERKGGEVGVHPEARLPADNLRLLVGRAALIFKGVVSGIQYETDARTGLPFTYVTFRQVEPIKDLSGEFGTKKRKTIRLRLFGGLKENGTMTLMSHVPSFKLGAVYVVFYTGGAWDVSPVVGGERGVFQVIRSRTLGYEMVFDHFGNVVVGIADQDLQALPLGPRESTEGPRELGQQQEAIGATQTDQVKIDRNSIYSEEGVKRMLEGQEPGKAELEKSDVTAVRSQMLKDLSSPPMSLEAFTKSVLELDRRHAGEFHEFYSRLDFQGSPVEKDRNPLGLRQEQGDTQ